MEFAPRGLCVYCGRVRAPDAPAAPCPGCGRDATAVVWEEVGVVTRDAESLAWTLAGMILPAAYLVYAAVRWTFGAPPTLRAALIAAAATLTLGWLAARALRRPYGSWAFYTTDLALVGSAAWDDRTLTWAEAHERVGARIELPPSVAALTEERLGALDPEAFEASLSELLSLSDAGRADLRERGEHVPQEALAVAGMIARGALRGYWRKGWRQTTILSPSWGETRELALEEGDATLARGPFEARVLATLAEVTREPAAAADTATAHYRAAAEGPLTRIASWGELIDRWEDADVPWEATGVRVDPDAAEADDTRRAMAAASAADADLVAALLEVDRAR
jgi:hypothetical protein